MITHLHIRKSNTHTHTHTHTHYTRAHHLCRLQESQLRPIWALRGLCASSVDGLYVSTYTHTDTRTLHGSQHTLTITHSCIYRITRSEHSHSNILTHTIYASVHTDTHIHNFQCSDSHVHRCTHIQIHTHTYIHTHLSTL
jgi:hypothetical protein